MIDTTGLQNNDKCKVKICYSNSDTGQIGKCYWTTAVFINGYFVLPDGDVKGSSVAKFKKII